MVTLDREHFQRRLRITYGLFALLIGGLVVFGTAAATALDGGHLKPPGAAALPIVGAFVIPLIASLSARGELRKWTSLAAIDAATLLGLMTCVSVTAAGSPESLRGEHFATNVFTFVVTLRAALLPSPPGWTALVSAIGAIPAALIPIFFGGEPQATQTFLQLTGIGWCLAATIAAWAISRVVYGIQQKLADAEQLGQYTLEEKIGEGGMGTVYRARHAMLRRPTAIKLLRTRWRDDQSSKRFEKEVQLTSALTHPNTIAIYDYGHTFDGTFYYAMELLDGVALAELVEREGPQPPGRVIHILRQAAEALAEAHAVGLIHRDVKPANIFLCTRGGIHDFVKLLDFGLVKELHAKDPVLSSHDTIAGTPLFMAPESVTSPDAVDARVDIYALGAVGYTLLSGDVPFPGTNVVEIYHGHLYGRPRPIEHVRGSPVPQDLELLLLECLAKAPNDRPDSARALAARLERLQERHPWTDEDAQAAWSSHPRSTPPSPHPDPARAPTVAVGLRVAR